jgi:hypothetical protein
MARGSAKPVIAVFALAVAAVIAWIVIDATTVSSEVKQPLLNLPRPRSNHPDPSSTTLHLNAGGLTLCFPEEDEPKIEDLAVRETQAEVIIRGTVRVFEGENNCEVNGGGVDFDVRLERALGKRQIVDESRGLHRVIWSPALRRMVLRALAYSNADAERFALSALSGNHSAKCFRYGVRAFSCSAKPADEKRQYFQVVVARTGQLSIEPEHALTPTSFIAEK